MKAMMGISQEKKAMIKQREMSSISISLISPYFTMRIRPRVAIPTTTMDQPRISHFKKSDKEALQSLLFFRTDIILSHEGLKVRSEHPHFFCGPGHIPVISFQGIDDKNPFNVFNGLFP